MTHNELQPRGTVNRGIGRLSQLVAGRSPEEIAHEVVAQLA